MILKTNNVIDVVDEILAEIDENNTIKLENIVNMCEIYRKITIEILKQSNLNIGNLCYGCIAKYLKSKSLINLELSGILNDLMVIRNVLVHSIYNYYRYKNKVNYILYRF